MLGFNIDSKPENPMGTDGFEFVEYAAPDPVLLRDLFEKLGFPAIGKHKSRDISLHRQGDINFVINAEKTGFAADFVKKHGPCACSMGFRVKDAKAALDRAKSLMRSPSMMKTGFYRNRPLKVLADRGFIWWMAMAGSMRGKAIMNFSPMRKSAWTVGARGFPISTI